MLCPWVVRRYFSAQSRQARITGLVDALSDHFTSFFSSSSVTWEQSLLCAMKEVQALAVTFDHLPRSLAPAERSATWNTRPAFCRSARPLNECLMSIFRSHNGMLLMSCNDLPVDGHASVLFSHPPRRWQLTMVWTLLLEDNARLHFTASRLQVSQSLRFFLASL